MSSGQGGSPQLVQDGEEYMKYFLDSLLYQKYVRRVRITAC